MLKLDNISKRYEGKTVLENFTLEVNSGEFFAVLGPSGSGKTTLLGLISGVLPPDAGKLFWRGEDITNKEPRRRNSSYVFQNYALLPHLSVFENIAFPLGASRYSSAGFLSRANLLMRSLGASLLPDQVHEVLSALALVKLEGYGDRRVQTLSGGEAQRVALARALVTHPSLLLMDEPLANLDRQLKLEMRAELKRIHKQTGVTIIYVTHDQEEAVTLADRMAIMRAGRLEQAGTPSDILKAPSSDWVRQFFNKNSIVNPELLLRLQ